MKRSMVNQTRIVLDSIADGVFNWKSTSFNKAAEKITGIKAREAINRYCWDVFKASTCESRCTLRQTMEIGIDHNP